MSLRHYVVPHRLTNFDKGSNHVDFSLPHLAQRHIHWVASLLSFSLIRYVSICVGADEFSVCTNGYPYEEPRFD
jgi:hypothetical protein